MSVGYIYKITCIPTGKSYIGQTKRSVDERVKDHFKAANYKIKEGCLALNAAIRLYGRENFIYETERECDVSKLNYWEVLYIEFLETLAPDGYNLSKGGDVPLELCEESKMRQSQNRREYYIDENLPIHVQHLKTKYGEGYIYENTGYKKAQFCSNKLTMEQKRELVVQYANNPMPTGGKRGKISYTIKNGKVLVTMPK